MGYASCKADPDVWLKKAEKADGTPYWEYVLVYVDDVMAIGTEPNRPELDVTPELDAESANFYQSMIGVLRWAVELGRIDIATEVSMLSAHLALPRAGHFDAILKVFGYLKRKHNARLVFDPTYPDINFEEFRPNPEWKKYYGNVSEPIPPNAPEERGLPVVVHGKVDSDHAGEKLTRRSRTCFIIYVNSAPIVWHSKRQTSIETSTFGSEFVAMKTMIEALRGLRYKLRMMGVPIDGPSYVRGDNEAVIKSTLAPDSTLKKKNNAIAYHYCRESVAMDETRTCYVHTDDNEADILTKVLPQGPKRTKFIQQLLWDVEDDHRSVREAEKQKEGGTVPVAPE